MYIYESNDFRANIKHTMSSCMSLSLMCRVTMGDRTCDVAHLGDVQGFGRRMLVV